MDTKQLNSCLTFFIETYFVENLNKGNMHIIIFIWSLRNMMSNWKVSSCWINVTSMIYFVYKVKLFWIALGGLEN